LKIKNFVKNFIYPDIQAFSSVKKK
jgi:hypothetical protein